MSMQGWLPWALGSAFFAALTAILAKAGVDKMDSNLATALRTTVVLVLTWAIVVATGAARKFPEADGKSAGFLVLSGLATGASWLCYFRALKLGPASSVAPVDKLSVVFVWILSLVLLHEAFSWKTAAGILLMVAGALLVARK